MTALLTIERADGTVRAYTEAGALPLPLVDIAKPSAVLPILWTDGRGWTRLVPRNVGTAPAMEDWLTELLDFDTPVQSINVKGNRARLFIVP